MMEEIKPFSEDSLSIVPETNQIKIDLSKIE